ncbi:MAG: YceI family protein [Bdellovibrionales bacterium]|nr:YceI family protein [Bdellovibrionales bacterium]
MKTMIIAALVLLSPAAFADTYTIDPASSVIVWKAGKKMGSFHNGTVKVKSGEVEADAEGQVKAVKVVADMTTIANDDLKKNPEYQAKLVRHLSSEDFFKVEEHPEATFELSSVEAKKGAKGEYLLKGKLTMIGSTQAVEFPAKISTDQGMLSGNATLKVERLKWGLKYGSGSLFKELTADKIINDSFDLTLKLVAKK